MRKIFQVNIDNDDKIINVALKRKIDRLVVGV